MPYLFCRGLQLDPRFISIEADDNLEYSRVAQDKNLELWLLQIPLDVSCLCFRLSASFFSTLLPAC